jgi:23S rRNA (guanine2535-N1)-methyltransferase
MTYKFVTENQDYKNYASGRVIYTLPGLPAFPVRLASEIFLRAQKHLSGQFPMLQRLTLADPTCGSAYHLTTLGLLHGQAIGTIIASDVDELAVTLARRNLGLLSSEGLDRREREIHEMLEKFGKESHAEALESIAIFRQHIQAAPPIHTRVFQANTLDRETLKKELSGETIHLVISDIPYGQLSAWHVPDSADLSQPPLWHMLAALRPVLATGAIVAIAADKSQKISHEGYRRIERFKVGKRQVSFLSPLF